MASSVKQGIFYFLFAVLLLPLLQLYLPFVKSAPLSGIGNAPDVNFSLADWWDGTYQTKKSKYFDDNVGFRADFVRVNSQLNYSVFNYIHAGHIIEGEQNYLYMSDYIDSYYGRDFIGADSIRRQMVKLKAVQDTLQKLRKTLVLAYAPSKEFMYPEYIPAKLRGKRTTTNFETYLHTGTSVGINQLDLNTWYCGLKGMSREVLYPKLGIHWSVYGSYLAGDTLVKYIERLRHVHMPHPVFTSLERTFDARYSDNDIGSNINLMQPPVQELLTYPQVAYSKDSALNRPNIIYIGDSFLQIWMWQFFMENISTDWQLWYYFREVWKWGKIDNHIDSYDWKKELEKADCIVIMYTTSNLPEMGNGFIEQAYSYYYPGR